MKVPKSILESEVLFRNLEDSISKLKKEESIYINQKLNNYFQNEILLGLIGDKISAINLSEQLNKHVAILDYAKYTDITPLELVREILKDVEKTNNELKGEISKIREDLLTTKYPSSIANQKIGELLALKIPLKDNHIFRDEIGINKTEQ